MASDRFVELKTRLIRAAKLDPELYRELDDDPNAMNQAIGVVLISSLAAGVGSTALMGASAIVSGTILGVISWYLWGYLTHYIGTKFFPEPETDAHAGKVLRNIGFSTAPGLLRVFGLITPLYLPLALIVSIWMLMTMVVAVREALNYTSTQRAVTVCVMGFFVQFILILLLSALFAAA